MSNSALYAQELLSRREVRRDMNKWAEHCGFVPAKHHKLLNEKLMAAARREVRKLMVFMPPGSAKSTYSSVLFPPHFLANYVNNTILLCSHSKDLAESFGRKCRNLIDQNPLPLGYALAKDSQAAGEWATDKGGGFFCAGVGGRISGRRADLAVIDDPVGSREDADSKTIRDKQWDWYKTDFVPRLKPGAVRILIQTRFHEDDLAGRILSKEKDWEVIRLPMLAEENDPLGRTPGELLWPEWFTPEMALEAQQDERTFSSLYQQRPTPESGNFFKSEWLREYDRDSLPKDLQVYVGSDHAVSLRQEADRTCILPVGIDGHGDIWVLPDVVWKRMDTRESVDQMLAVAARRKPLMWWSEAAHIEKSIGPFLRERQEEQGVYFAMDQLSSARDKRTKAQAIQGMMAMGKVHFPSFCDWWSEAKRELLTFDAGTHDDFVDALANIGRGLSMLRGPRAATPPKETYPILSVKWLKHSCERQERLKVAQRQDW